MDPRRGGRPSQVSPRSPKHPGRTVSRRPEPSPIRLERYRRVERRRGLPFVAKAILGVSIVAMGGFILWAGIGGVGPFVAGLVKSVGGLVSNVGTAVGSPPPTEPPLVSGAPLITGPEQAYTNAEKITVEVTIPAAIVGQTDHRLRLWVTLKDAEPAVLAEAAIGLTSIVVLPDVALAKGRNDLQASIVGPEGESELSPVATWILDITKPKVDVTSPKDGASISKTSATVKGKTQGGSKVRLVNAANGAVATTSAGKDGLWETSIAIADGTNAIAITITDEAGNAATGSLTLRKGSGSVKLQLSANTYRLKAKNLPASITLTVRATAPDGGPLGGATVLFTLTVPGLEAIVSGEIVTDGDGTASFTTAIPAGATKGGGLATVLMNASGSGITTDRVVITIE